MTSDSERRSSIQIQKGLTRTLLKFCQDHKYPDIGLLEVRECLESLEQGDVKSAVQAYQKVPLGGRMGYFDEWVPPVVFSYETTEYVHFVFAALVAQWRSVMDLSLQVDQAKRLTWMELGLLFLSQFGCLIIHMNDDRRAIQQRDMACRDSRFVQLIQTFRDEEAKKSQGSK